MSIWIVIWVICFVAVVGFVIFVALKYNDPLKDVQDAIMGPGYELPPRDEGHLGGSFKVLKDFETKHGCYWKGHDYNITRHNYSLVEAAIKRGDAQVVIKPKARP